MGQDTRIDRAPDVETIAKRLIEQYHPELLECVIGYYTTTQAVPCAPKKLSPLLRFGFSLHIGAPRASVEEGPDFLLLINAEEWAYLLPGQHEGYLGHRLEHIVRTPTKDGGIRWTVKPDDLAEMNATVQRFGRYSFAVKRFGQILQPELDLVVSDQVRALFTAQEEHDDA